MCHIVDTRHKALAVVFILAGINMAFLIVIAFLNVTV